MTLSKGGQGGQCPPLLAKIRDRQVRIDQVERNCLFRVMSYFARGGEMSPLVPPCPPFVHTP